MPNHTGLTDSIAGPQEGCDGAGRPLMWPTGDADWHFTPPQLPDSDFSIRWDDNPESMDGPFDPSLWSVDPASDCAYTGGYPAHGTILRVTSQAGTRLQTVDDDGEPHTADLIADNPFIQDKN